MVPSIAKKNGASFRGAGAYYLHDKAEKGADKLSTSNRVAWTATRNLAHEQPDLAIDEMWRTAEDAAELKKNSGRSPHGRKSDTPVKTLSLSWAPHQRPTRDQMEAAADSFLQAMGWHEHQALLVAHNDEPHRHLHILLNRVHPETGMTLNDWNERKRAQRWALAFEREEGEVLCLARVEKYEKGFDLQADGMPYPFAKLASEPERAFDNSEAHAFDQSTLEKELLAERHRQEREAFLATGKVQFREARHAAYRDVREEYKPKWRLLHRERSTAEQQLDGDTRTGHRHAVQLAREGDVEGAQQLLAELSDHRSLVREGLAESKRDLHRQQLDTTRDRQDAACRAVIEERGKAFQDIKDRQKDERTEARELLALRDAGAPHDVNRLHELFADALPAPIANDNERLPEQPPAEVAHARDRPSDAPSFNPFTQAAYELFGRHGLSEQPSKAPSRDITDAISGPLGALIEVGARMMESLFSPASPREQAIAKAWAIREAHEMPKREEARREEKMRQDFLKHALTAVREADAELEKRRMLDHEERGRSRHRER